MVGMSRRVRGVMIGLSPIASIVIEQSPSRDNQPI
jgi:hypothetical protein